MNENIEPSATQSRLAVRLRRALRGEVLFDAFSRGRYATDASFYQIMPLGVVTPVDEEDLAITLEIAREEGVPVLARGGGTSQSGQTVADALVIDFSMHFDKIFALDIEAGTAEVGPGLVLDEFNRRLSKTGMWFPVDVSTSSRATLGGMAGNNSCGSRSLRYGIMRDHVTAMDMVLADGKQLHAGIFDPAIAAKGNAFSDHLATDLHLLAAHHADELAMRLPRVLRRVGGYNLDALLPAMSRPSGEKSREPGAAPNLAHLFVGSEGTLGTVTRLHLRLSPMIRHRALGICHFPTFYSAMDSAQHLVTLKPVAVELMDRTMIELARSIPMFAEATARFVRGEPAALLMVEFAEEDEARGLQKLDELDDMMGDLGLPGAVVRAVDPAFQASVWGVRTEGLNIMMSMREARKPVSFIEDTAVPLEYLAEYTASLTELFARHGTSGTWYAHASEGCLHVRPVLNLKQDIEVRRMRAIAEETFELVRRYKGSHSGEHGDGLVRSEFNERMFGPILTGAFRDVKTRLDPSRRLNPGKIVDAPKMDDRSLFRFPPGYEAVAGETVLDWTKWNGFDGAAEMCNNNGACRKLAGGIMCPSFRVTRNERDVVRGRANTLRLALSGQLGHDAFAAPEMAETMALCVSCKGCRRECPTGVDMARLKIEVQARRVKAHGLSLGERAVAYLPRLAPWLSRIGPIANLAARLPGVSALLARGLSFSQRRSFPIWQKAFRQREPLGRGMEVVLFVDTFNRHFDPTIVEAAVEVLIAAGCQVHFPAAPAGRALCCGRTYLTSGLGDEARIEAHRVIAALAPYARRGVPVVGLEPSCLMTLRDEYPDLIPGEESRALSRSALMFEEFLESRLADGSLSLGLRHLDRPVLLHGHCHQKSFDALRPVEALLQRIPGIALKTIESSCCGMAGAFGFGAKTFDISMKMGELSLLPAMRAAPKDAILVADGTSCRHQIRDGAQREAMHAAVVLQMALEHKYA